ncbi:hypothetical protein M758_5G090000 [Ceratodon purpureus]|nr:hypothetical protein M758_5G090000 [Ceratodon purpureus]
MEYFLMQDQQRTTLLNCPQFLDSYPSSTCDSVYATPYNNMESNAGHRQHMMAYPAYYVESPSTVVDMSSVGYGYDEDHRTSERLTEPFSASLLSRSTSFLSNCTSEPVSLPDVSARLQSWCKSRPPSLVPNKWETCDEEAGFGTEENARSRCCDILKSFTLWLCLTVFLTAFLLALSTSMYWLICHPHAPSTIFKGVEFRRFNVHQGYDRTGVPTDMVSLESLVKLSFSNPSKHYGAFVSGATVGLSYLPRPIAHGQVPDFYQDCHSKRDVVIKANSEYEPLYGAGPSLQQAILENRHIALGLTISVKSHVNLFGSLVKKHFTEIIACNVLLNPNTESVTATYCEPPRREESGDIRRLRRHSP